MRTPPAPLPGWKKPPIPQYLTVFHGISLATTPSISKTDAAILTSKLSWRKSVILQSSHHSTSFHLICVLKILLEPKAGALCTRQDKTSKQNRSK
jgi:hypothetical protein